MIDVPDPADHAGIAVDLDVVGHTAVTLALDHPGRVPVQDLVGLLRATGAVGWVRGEAPERVLLMLATVAGDDGVDRLVVLGEDALVTGPVLEAVVGEVAARCGAHVCVTQAPDEDEGEDDLDGKHAGEVGRARRVLAYRSAGPIDRPTALEVASLLGTDVVLVPAGGWVLVVPADEEVDPFTPWPRRQRPVLSLRQGPEGTLEVSAHLLRGGGSGGVGARALDHSLPGWWWSSSTQPVEVLVSAERRAGLGEVTAAAIAQLLMEPSPAAIAALVAQLSPVGLDLPRLLAVESAAEGAVGEVVAALAWPQVAAQLLVGEVDAADLPGAVVGERRGLLGMVAQTMLARPQGTSPLAQMGRWDYDHPARSVAYILTVASLAGLGYAVAATDGHALSRRPWPTVLTVAAVALSLDAVANAVVLGVVRRRLHHGRS